MSTTSDHHGFNDAGADAEPAPDANGPTQPVGEERADVPYRREDWQPQDGADL